MWKELAKFLDGEHTFAGGEQPLQPGNGPPRSLRHGSRVDAAGVFRAFRA